MTRPYPLTAIVGQESLIEALLINAVSPEVGGVLVRGERGTAKSTAVRGLAPLLPPVTVASGQAFAFAPGELGPDGRVPGDSEAELRPASLVELPLGASLDRLVGALDLGRALNGEKAFEAGLLARAHQGILYVDEVNLLPDHLVDALLDAAASGVSRVERDAVSAVHDARFLLVGTMNVEEGELRPQLLDRFGLGVEVIGPPDPAVRAEIVRRRLSFERDPEAFAREWEGAEGQLAARIAAARERLPSVRLPERELLRITAACAALGVDGVRGDIVTARAARALAALAGADEVGEEHVRAAAALALLHRRRHDPLDGRAPSPDDVDRALDDEPPPEPPPDPPRGGAPPEGHGAESPPAEGGADAPSRARRDAPAPARLPAEALHIAGTGSGPGGRRARSTGPGAGAIDARPAAADSDDVSIVATLRARLVQGDDAGLREHVRAGRESVLLCLVVDASGSMGARRRLARVKGALLASLREAYERRDRVAIVAFRGSDAQLLVPPGAPLEAAAEAIRGLPTGGRTPLAAGLALAEQVIRREAGRDRGQRAIAVILTDGRVADPDGLVRRAAARLGRAAGAAHVIDIEDGQVRLGLAATLANAAGARLHALSDPTRDAEDGRISDAEVPDQLVRHGGDEVDVPHTPGDTGSAEPLRRKRRDKPLVIVITGHGKGKSTAAFGMLLRSWARGYRCGVFQFVKSGKWKVGEAKAAAALGGIDWEKMGDGWSWISKDLEESADKAREGWAGVKRMIAEERYEFMLLDEITYPIKWGWIDLDDVIATLRDRPGFQHIVLTGRDAPPELIAAADLASEVVKLKHPMDAGIRAQQGIEW